MLASRHGLTAPQADIEWVGALAPSFGLSTPATLVCEQSMTGNGRQPSLLTTNPSFLTPPPR